MLASAAVRRFPVLRARDFRLLLADRLVAPFAFAFSLVGVSFAVLDSTGSTASLSYVLAAQIVPSLLFTALGGVVADRIPPQRVIVAANAMIALGEGTFGLLVITGHPRLWEMLALEMVTGTGMALFYPASQALLPRLVSADLLLQASAVSRLAMNAGQMAGAMAAGFFVAAAGPGWALLTCAVGILTTAGLLLRIRVTGFGQTGGARPSMVRELRAGWSEFRSHSWLWAVVLQYAVVMAAWYGGFQVLGPVVARAHLGGAAAWGLITSAEAVGLIAGGIVSLRFQPRRPVLFVCGIGGLIALYPLSLAMLWPLAVICVFSLVLGAAMETMMVQWTVTMARRIPPAMLARVTSYDALGSVMAMPVGALLAGPIAAAVGVSATQYGAAALILVASLLVMIPREVRMRATDYDALHPAAPAPSVAEPAGAAAAPAS
jgi:predicted MFS family arabinose efflux permease